MARNKVVNMSLDEEEYSLFMEAMIEYENINSNGRVSIGKFMRTIILPMFNVDNKPNVYDEIRKHDEYYQKIVSRQSEDTDSANSNNSIPESKHENVSSQTTHTESKQAESFDFSFDE